jgi:hypothetical protein
MITTRFRLFFDFDREERWLSAMAGEGLALVGRSSPGFYRFRPADPEDAVIRIDYRYFRRKKDFVDYRVLFADSGWRHIAGSRFSGALYFKKISSSAADQIFSDQASKAGRYQRWSGNSLSLATALLPLAAACRRDVHPRSCWLPGPSEPQAALPDAGVVGKDIY